MVAISVTLSDWNILFFYQSGYWFMASKQSLLVFEEICPFFWSPFLIFFRSTKIEHQRAVFKKIIIVSTNQIVDLFFNNRHHAAHLPPFWIDHQSKVDIDSWCQGKAKWILIPRTSRRFTAILFGRHFEILDVDHQSKVDINSWCRQSKVDIDQPIDWFMPQKWGTLWYFLYLPQSEV